MKYKNIYKPYNITFINKFGKENYGNIILVDKKNVFVRELNTDAKIEVQFNSNTGLYHEKPSTHAKVQFIILHNADSFVIHNN